VIERATLSDSVGFLRGLRLPPTYIKSPNIVYRANNVLDSCGLPYTYLQICNSARLENSIISKQSHLRFKTTDLCCAIYM
jgi:hypothetical protein